MTVSRSISLTLGKWINGQRLSQFLYKDSSDETVHSHGLSIIGNVVARCIQGTRHALGASVTGHCLLSTERTFGGEKRQRLTALR